MYSKPLHDRVRKMNIRVLQNIALLSCFLLFALSPGVFAAIINDGFIVSNTNQDAEVVLTSVPLNITEPDDNVEISWSPAITGSLLYIQGTPGPDSEYELIQASPLQSGGGFISFSHSAFPQRGVLTCLITTQEGNSAPFTLIIAASEAPVGAVPETGSGQTGINTVAPVFEWNSIDDVPFYYIIVADQPFQIIDDEEGMRVEGANLIWHAITPNTSIQYGIDDPSGTIDNYMVPPLVGDDDPNNRPRYTWIVLNNYGNHPAFSSSVIGNPTGFEIEVEAPFDAPVNIQPTTGASIIDDEFLMQWSNIPDAISYFVYISRLETSGGGSEVTVPIWSAQTTENAIVIPASSVLQSGEYHWKVIAADDQGYGAMSDTSLFNYSIDSGTLVVLSRTAENTILEYVQLDFQTVNGPFINPSTTDDQGWYSREFPLGTYIITGSKAGYSEAVSQEITITSGSTSYCTLVLERPPSTVNGRAFTAGEGTGISGADLEFVNSNGDEYETTSGLNGNYSVNLPGGTWVLSATAEGHQPRDTSFTIGTGETRTVDRWLYPYNYTLSGSVTNADGEAIHLAHVTASLGGENQVSAYTNQAGTYELTLGTGTWTVAAYKSGFYLEESPEVIISGDNEILNITLHPQAAVISGNVYINGQPGSDNNLIVRATPSVGEPIEGAVSNSGAFSLGLSAGNYQVRGILSGHTSTVVDVNLLPGDAISNLVIHLTENQSAISGIVQSVDGELLGGATVSTGGISVVTNNSGQYTINVPSGDYLISAQIAGYGMESSGPWTVGPGQNLNGVNLTLEPNGGSVAGRVRSSGQGIVGAMVTATRANGDEFQVYSTSGGNYMLNLAAGTYDLTARASGFTSSTIEDFAIQPGVDNSNINFNLIENTGILGGTVTTINGSPIIGVAVVIQATGSDVEYETVTNTGGSFSAVVIPGEYLVTLQKNGYLNVSDGPHTVTAGEEVWIQLQMETSEAIIRGNVSTDEYPVSNALVYAEQSGESYSAVTQSNGSYVLNISPGTFSVTVSAAGFTETSGTLVVQPGDNRNGVNWEVNENFANIAGTVVESGSDPVPQASIKAVAASGSEYNTVTDSYGSYLFDRLLGGNYTIISRKTGFLADTLAVGLILDGQTRENANLTMIELGSGIHGLVDDQDSNPVNYATIIATLNSSGEEFSAVSASDGSYEFSNIPSGTFTVQVIKSGYSHTPVTQIVGENQDVELSLEIVENTGFIEGYVRNASTSNGLQGAQVTVNLGGNTGSRRVFTGANGRFRIEELNPTNPNFLVEASLEGYVTQEQTIAVNTNNALFQLQANTLIISGVLVDQGSNPIGNTGVIATNLATGNELSLNTNVSGEFQFTRIPANTNFRLQSVIDEAGYVEADVIVEVGTTNISGLELEAIRQTGTITGSVGVAGALVRADGPNTIRRQVYAGEGGIYNFDLLRDGQWIITPSLAGYAFAPASQTVTLSINQEVTDIDFTSSSTMVSLNGTVSIENVGVVEGWSVRLTGTGLSRIATTTGDGMYSFDDVPGNSTYTVYPIAPEDYYVVEPLEVVVGTENREGLNLSVIPEAGVINGTFSSSDEENPDIPYLFVQVDDDGPVEQYSGVFSFGSLRSGTHRLVFSERTHLNDTLFVTLASGLDTTSRSVVLEKLSNGLVFEIRYNDSENGIIHRLSNARVTLTPQNGNDPIVKCSDEAGFVHFNNLDPGTTYNASIVMQGFTSSSRDNLAPGSGPYPTYLTPLPGYIVGKVTGFSSPPGITIIGESGIRTQASTVVNESETIVTYAIAAPEEPFTIFASQQDENSFAYTRYLESGDHLYLDLRYREEAGNLYVHVRDQNNANITRGSIQLESLVGSNQFTFGFIESDGYARLRGIRPAQVRVLLDVNGYQAVTPSSPYLMVIPAGEVTELDWFVEPVITGLVGVVNGTYGESANAEVSILLAGESDPYTVITDASGQFQFAGLDNGVYDILGASKFGYEIANSISDPTQVTISNDLQEATIQMVPEDNSVFGTVRNADGDAGVPEVYVSLRNSDGTAVGAMTNSDGQFSFSNVADGTYILSTPGRVAIPQTRELVISTQGSADNNFRLVQSQGTAAVYGVVSHLGTGIGSVEVVIRKVGGATTYETVTTASGDFGIQSIAAPGTYRLTATHPNYGTAESEPFTLAANDAITRNIALPDGRIFVNVNEQPVDADSVNLEGINVSVVALDGSQTFNLVTDANGNCSTDAVLPYGDWVVNYIRDRRDGWLSPGPHVITLSTSNREASHEFVFNPMTGPSSNEPVGQGVVIRVQLQFSGVSRELLENARKELLYGISSVFGVEPSRVRIATIEVVRTQILGSEGSEYQEAPEGEIGLVGASSGRRLQTDRPVSEVQEVVTLVGEIPGQEESGYLTFYPEIELEDGTIFGGQNAAQTIRIYAPGVASRATFSTTSPSSFQEAVPGVPMLMSVRVYDEGDNNITSSISNITWDATLNNPEVVSGSPNQAIYLATEDDVIDTVTVVIAQTDQNVEIVKTVAITNRYREIASIDLNAAEEVLSGESITFTAVALDTGGVLTMFDATWSPDTCALGSLTEVPYRMRAVFQTVEDHFGEIEVTVRDDYSDVEATLEVPVLLPVVSSPGMTYTGTNDEGVNLRINFLSTARAGKEGKISLTQVPLKSVQLAVGARESVFQEGYQFELEGDLNEAKMQYTLELPLPMSAVGRDPQIAYWDYSVSDWVSIGGIVSEDERSIFRFFTGSSTSISNMFTIIVDSKPLGIENLRFDPNPFSPYYEPYADAPLSIEFTVHSDVDPHVLVTIKIFNMAGQPVRTLLDRSPVAKGFQHTRSNDPIIWDGLTNAGTMARNGRYVVHIEVEDSTGESEEVLETVVLIK